MPTFKLPLPALLAFLLMQMLPALAATHTVDGLQHTGAVHFYAQPGLLQIDLWKNDAPGNKADRSLTAILTGPDGTEHDRLKLVTPTDKPDQRLEGQLRVQVVRAGIYTLLLSANQDQYLSAQTIGFSTNATQFVLNSGAGHADRKREETIILNGGQKPFSVFFKPVQRSFTIQLTRLPATVKAVELRDADGALVQTLHAAEGKAQATISEETGKRNGIWELRLPQQRGHILIEGLNTGWQSGEKPLPVWASSRDSYFALEDYHWLLQPRRFARNTRAGAQGTIAMTVANNAAAPMSLELSLDAPATLGTLQVSPNRLEVAPYSTQTVQVQYALPATLAGGRHDIVLTARDTRTNRQAFSLLQLRTGEATDTTVRPPLALKLYEHDQFQFAYEPDYPRDNQFYFDIQNRPWQVTKDGIQTLVDGEWKSVQLPGTGQQASYPVHALGFDTAGYAYGIVRRDGKTYLLRADSKTLRAELVELPEGGYYTPETFSGGKVSAYPPALLRYVVDSSKAQVAFWSRVHKLELYLPQIKDGKLQLGSPILVSDNCVGMSAHSGITSPVAADGDRLHLIWGETSDPAKKDPGVPTYTATYNRKTGQLTQPVFLAWSPPVNDVHNMSTLIVDSRGGRHVIIGSHGKPFQYLYSPAGSSEWSAPREITQSNPTYIGAVLDSSDNIHLFFRQWKQEIAFTGAELGYQKMEHGGEWKPQIPFARSPLPGYSVFYHRLTADRAGRLYLSFTCWSTWSPYRESYPTAVPSRLVFSSNDQGKSWQIVTTESLAAGMEKRRTLNIQH